MRVGLIDIIFVTSASQLRILAFSKSTPLIVRSSISDVFLYNIFFSKLLSWFFVLGVLVACVFLRGEGVNPHAQPILVAFYDKQGILWTNSIPGSQGYEIRFKRENFLNAIINFYRVPLKNVNWKPISVDCTCVC